MQLHYEVSGRCADSKENWIERHNTNRPSMTIEGWTPRHTCLVDIGDERGEVRNVVSGRKQNHSAYNGGCNFRSQSCLLYPTGLLTL